MSDRRERSPEPRRGSVYEDRPPPSERREHHFTLHLPSGVILSADDDPPDFPDAVEDVPDSEWRELGSIDPVTGQARVNWARSRRWQSLAELLRWR